MVPQRRLVGSTTGKCVEKERASFQDKFFLSEVILFSLIRLIKFINNHIYMLAQTTDSGSNNITMAKEMYDQLSNIPGSSLGWNPERMHIRCFCHKLALVVNAGLKELGMKAPPPPKVKESILGHFPLESSLATIPEEEELDDKMLKVVEDDSADGNSDGSKEDQIYDDNEASSGDSEDDQVTEPGKNESSQKSTNRHKSNELNDLTQSVCLIVFVEILCIFIIISN